jgi:polysaccharide biosynthesis transport protein
VSEPVTAAGEADFLRSPALETTVQRAKAKPLPGSPRLNEGFRLLALNCRRLLSDSVRRSIVVLSASPREGRSTTAAGLATAMSQIMPPVVLIDADPDGSGLSGLVPDSTQELGDGLVGSRPSLQVVNPPFPEGTSGTFLDTVQDAVQDALDGGATVIVDAPACLASSAAFYLATAATGVLYVTRRNSSQDANVHADIGAQLELLGARVLGVVVNEG